MFLSICFYVPGNYFLEGFYGVSFFTLFPSAFYSPETSYIYSSFMTQFLVSTLLLNTIFLAFQGFEAKVYVHPNPT